MPRSLVLKSCTTRDRNLRLGPEAGSAKKSARSAPNSKFGPSSNNKKGMVGKFNRRKRLELVQHFRGSNHINHALSS
jgi:hypothetical protein